MNWVDLEKNGRLLVGCSVMSYQSTLYHQDFLTTVSITLQRRLLHREWWILLCWRPMLANWNCSCPRLIGTFTNTLKYTPRCNVFCTVSRAIPCYIVSVFCFSFEWFSFVLRVSCVCLFIFPFPPLYLPPPYPHPQNGLSHIRHPPLASLSRRRPTPPHQPPAPHHEPWWYGNSSEGGAPGLGFDPQHGHLRRMSHQWR